jgi:hypothetical protein
MPAQSREFGAFLIPVGLSASLLFLAALAFVAVGAGAISLAAVIGAAFLSLLTALFLFTPIAFVVALITRPWRTRTAVACLVVAILFVAASLWYAQRVPAPERESWLSHAPALGIALAAGQAVFVIAWARLSPSSGTVGAT